MEWSGAERSGVELMVHRRSGHLYLTENVGQALPGNKNGKMGIAHALKAA